MPVDEDFEFRSAMFNPRTLDGDAVRARARPACRARRPLESGESGRFRIRATALDGRELVLDGSVSPAAGGAVIVFRDVTEEHQRRC